MVLKALVRRASASLVAVFCVAAPVVAGNSAQFSAIGYSQDGRYFAFEQFGIQDGSGFPFSEIFLIDLDTDSFVGGAPFEARIDTETAKLSEARAEAIELAGEALATYDITRPALPVALRGDGELGDQGLSISYGIPSYGLAETKGEYGLRLDLFKAPSPRDCTLFEGDPVAFTLTRKAYGVTEEIYSDTNVPASRNCVITYKFYGVFIPFEDYDNASAVAVLSVWSHGFEGPDRRFIALPVGER